MAGRGSDKGEDAKRAAERAAKVVLAKHPVVVPGSVHPTPIRTDVPSRAVDIGLWNIGRGMRR